MEVTPGELEVDGCVLEPFMAHQQLNRAQVGAGFEQVRGKGVPQRVRVDLLLQSGTRSRCAAGVPDGLIGDGLPVYAPLARGAGKEIAARLLPQPPAAQFFEQLR